MGSIPNELGARKFRKSDYVILKEAVTNSPGEGLERLVGLEQRQIGKEWESALMAESSKGRRGWEGGGGWKIRPSRSRVASAVSRDSSRSHSQARRLRNRREIKKNRCCFTRFSARKNAPLGCFSLIFFSLENAPPSFPTCGTRSYISCTLYLYDSVHSVFFCFTFSIIDHPSRFLFRGSKYLLRCYHEPYSRSKIVFSNRTKRDNRSSLFVRFY